MSNLNSYSQINNSTSKAMYSFSKSSRPSMAKKLYCDVFYQIPTTKSKRKTSFGYGNKTNWEELNKSKKDVPPPGTYSPDDLFEMNKKARKGFNPGVGRQEAKSQSFVQFDKSIPGPQRYGKIDHHPEGPKYSIRPKTAAQIFVKRSSMIIPGPGKYKPSNQMNPEGKYYISKWESSKAKRFDPKSSSRFSELKAQSPGPGQYTPRNSMIETEGCITESRYVSTGNRIFAQENRKTVFEEEPKKFKCIPGPGMYDLFSEFGSLKDLSKKKQKNVGRPVTSKVTKN